MTTYAEPIPTHCPPDTAMEPEGLIVYRLVETDPPADVDFQSHAVHWPERFGLRTDCDAWSLSVVTDRRGLDRIRGLPAHRHKRIARLTLKPADGRVAQSGRDPSHHSWWRYAGPSPTVACEVL